MPTVAAQAMLEPLMAANTPHARIVATPSEFGRPPTQALVQANRSRPASIFSTSTPVKMNSGIATSSKIDALCQTMSPKVESAPSTCLTMTKPMKAERPIETNTGTDSSIKPNSSAIVTRPAASMPGRSEMGCRRRRLAADQHRGRLQHQRQPAERDRALRQIQRGVEQRR